MVRLRISPASVVGDDLADGGDVRLEVRVPMGVEELVVVDVVVVFHAQGLPS